MAEGNSCQNVGILTYHNTRNCGAALQAYALQKTLLSIGINAEIIDYRCSKIEEAYHSGIQVNLQNFRQLIKKILLYRDSRSSQKKFDAFSCHKLIVSAKYDRATIRQANKKYDAFITGSDQVWNFDLNGNDYTYLLDFVATNKSRIAYAASCGGYTAASEVREVMKRELAAFKKISVRESDLKIKLSKVTDQDICVVLDPTLLLDKCDYSFAGSISSKKYIFVYTIAATPHVEMAARALSDATGLEVVWGHMSYKKKRGYVNRRDLGPDEFISYIKNAEYVVTSSFHGMAFSIIFEKQFFFDLDNKKQNNNDRLISLAESLGLQTRNLSHCQSDLISIPQIDYQRVRQKLAQLKEQSIAFLIDCFN